MWVNTVSTLTVVNALSSLPTVLVEEADTSDNAGQLLQLFLLVQFAQSHECTQLHLRKHTLKGSW